MKSINFENTIKDAEEILKQLNDYNLSHEVKKLSLIIYEYDKELPLLDDIRHLKKDISEDRSFEKENCIKNFKEIISLFIIHLRKKKIELTGEIV